MRGLSPVATSGGPSSSWCAGLSLSWPLLLRSIGSRCAGSAIVTHGPSRSASTGSRRAGGMWDLPRPGLEPMSPALVGRFSTTAPPRKPSSSIFRVLILWHHGYLAHFWIIILSYCLFTSTNMDSISSISVSFLLVFNQSDIFGNLNIFSRS